jgi:DNA invertase Pin-like site-specific DNA recombinase
MTMGVIAAVALFERDLLIERTLSGGARARAEGKTFGRKPVLGWRAAAEGAAAAVRRSVDQRGGAGDEGIEGNRIRRASQSAAYSRRA